MSGFPARILLSNDDGYRAPGLAALYEALTERSAVTVIAPDRNRSGASNSLTLTQPIRVVVHDDGFMSVEGTPTDCVHLGLTGLLDEEPHVVVSGCNAGPNLGDDVLYSGTVAAAMEGRHLGLPAIAVSSESFRPRHYATAARAVCVLLENFDTLALPPQTVMNVNVPDRPWSEIRGFQVTRLGNRHRAEPMVRDTDPRGNPIYWIGPAGPEQDAGPGTDFHAVREGFVSVTPLHVDLTRYDAEPVMRTWLDALAR